jgi:IS30 family transposase
MMDDQGREMAADSLLTQNTGVQVCFTHPHSPWESGINENTNSLLLQYFPKGSDFSVHSQEHLGVVAWRLNTRPRKSLAWMCPAELFMPEGSSDAVGYWKSTLNSFESSVALPP